MQAILYVSLLFLRGYGIFIFAENLFDGKLSAAQLGLLLAWFGDWKLEKQKERQECD